MHQVLSGSASVVVVWQWIWKPVASLSCGITRAVYVTCYFGVHSHLRFIRQAHSHLLFGQFLHGLISSIMGCAPIFLWLPRLKSSHNSSRLIDLRCVLGRLYYTTENFFLRNVCNLNMFPKWGKPFVNLFFFHRRQRSYTALITTGDMDIFTLAVLKVPLIASGSLQIWQLLTPIAFYTTL